LVDGINSIPLVPDITAPQFTVPSADQLANIQIPTDFEYLGLNTDLGHGWRLENKAYSNRYYNHQQYNNGTSITPTSATDKLNSYRKYGDIINVSQESKWGIFRAGLWYDWAYTDRYQIPSNILTWVNTVHSCRMPVPTGVSRITTSAITINVYGLDSARRTIHILLGFL